MKLIPILIVPELNDAVTFYTEEFGAEKADQEGVPLVVYEMKFAGNRICISDADTSVLVQAGAFRDPYGHLWIISPHAAPDHPDLAPALDVLVPQVPAPDDDVPNIATYPVIHVLAPAPQQEPEQVPDSPIYETGLPSTDSDDEENPKHLEDYPSGEESSEDHSQDHSQDHSSSSEEDISSSPEEDISSSPENI